MHWAVITQRQMPADSSAPPHNINQHYRSEVHCDQSLRLVGVTLEPDAKGHATGGQQPGGHARMFTGNWRDWRGITTCSWRM